MSTEIRVALVYQQEEASKALRAALANAGVGIAIERRASELDTAAILDSQVDAIVVNLDPELEDLLDEVTEALDTARQPVIFNDPAASSDLSGWDRARWLRHLSAKLKGRTDVTPPAPPGSEAIPTPAPRPSAAAMAATVVAVASGSVAGASGEPPAEPAMELSLADLDAMFEAPEAPVTVPSAAQATSLTMGDDLGDLDAFFEQRVELADLAPDPAPAAEPPPAAQAEIVATVDSGDTLDLDALFSAAPGRGPDEPAVQMASEDELNDLDALFSQPPASDPEDARIAPVATSAELNDLDALFREFEASKHQEPAPAAPAVAAAPEVKAAPADWSLEPLDDLLAEVPAGGPPAAAAPAPAAKAPSAPTIPPELEASLALADLKLVDDAAPVEAAESVDLGEIGDMVDLDSLDLSGLELEQLESAAPAVPVADAGDELSLTDIDFDFDLGNSAAASAPATANAGLDADLGDLDSLFAPMSATPAQSLSLPDLNRIFVLGASIGGPEAIKSFLARLPASVPAAFIVAQHMGSEFLEMMAAQLDAATALSVRFPKAGERLRHGEVLVAPANEHLTLDAEGRVQLSAAPSGSPYSPSIDQLAHDAADRFGDHATLILFSGMGTDAVEGGRYLTARGGQVWAQDRASCVIATMIDSAKSQGLLRFEGSPVQLAERVLELVS